MEVETLNLVRWVSLDRKTKPRDFDRMELAGDGRYLWGHAPRRGGSGSTSVIDLVEKRVVSEFDSSVLLRHVKLPGGRGDPPREFVACHHLGRERTKLYTPSGEQLDAFNSWPVDHAAAVLGHPDGRRLIIVLNSTLRVVQAPTEGTRVVVVTPDGTASPLMMIAHDGGDLWAPFVGGGVVVFHRVQGEGAPTGQVRTLVEAPEVLFQLGWEADFKGSSLQVGDWMACTTRDGVRFVPLGKEEPTLDFEISNSSIEPASPPAEQDSAFGRVEAAMREAAKLANGGDPGEEAAAAARRALDIPEVWRLGEMNSLGLLVRFWLKSLGDRWPERAEAFRLRMALARYIIA
ncbi:hypothetical protein H8E07_01740, partial [bacterium]|nr:hypothetical protein [bacterium]